MSAILTPYNNNVVQVGVYTAGDTYTHIRAGNLQFPGISCDTVSDLPAQAGGISGYYLEQGSTAHIIADNTEYMIDSGGNWILQDTTPYNNIYTKTEIDTIVSGIESRISGIESSVLDNTYMIGKLIDDGAKNILNVWGQSSQAISGITWTINNDGTVRAQGTATANSILYIWRNAFPPPAIAESIVVSGCPAGASDTTFDIAYTTNASGTISITTPQTISQAIAATTTRFGLRVYSGQTVDIVFKPMVCSYRKYQYSSEFVPYSPTNAELYQIIRSYHP